METEAPMRDERDEKVSAEVGLLFSFLFLSFLILALIGHVKEN